MAVVSTLVLAGLIGWVLWILYQNDQFTEATWQPFTDAAVLRNLAQGILLTLRAAAVAILLAPRRDLPGRSHRCPPWAI